MTTAAHDRTSTAELQLLLRAAVLSCAPAAHGREQARRTTAGLAQGLVAVAALVAAYDLSLLVGVVQ